MNDYSQPEPCEYCSLLAGWTKEHDGSCDDMTQEQYEVLIRAARIGRFPAAQ